MIKKKVQKGNALWFSFVALFYFIQQLLLSVKSHVVTPVLPVVVQSKHSSTFKPSERCALCVTLNNLSIYLSLKYAEVSNYSVIIMTVACNYMRGEKINYSIVLMIFNTLKCKYRGFSLFGTAQHQPENKVLSVNS